MVLFYNSNKPRFTHSGSKFNNNNKKKISLFWLLVNIKYILIFKYFWLLLFFFCLLGESLQTHTHTHTHKKIPLNPNQHFFPLTAFSYHKPTMVLINRWKKFSLLKETLLLHAATRFASLQQTICWAATYRARNLHSPKLPPHLCWSTAVGGSLPNSTRAGDSASRPLLARFCTRMASLISDSLPINSSV